MAAYVNKQGAIQMTNSKDKSRYVLTDSGRKAMNRQWGPSRHFLVQDTFDAMLKKGMIVPASTPVAKGNAGIAERNTASNSQGMNMFDTGHWLTRFSTVETNLVKQNTLASGSLLSIGGTLG